MDIALDRHWIERRFADFAPPPDHSGESNGELRAAAVLVPLVERSVGIQLVLTRRTDSLRAHAGQISFPGGCIEALDSDPVAAALRETEEEIGVSPEQVSLVGALPRYRTSTGFLVHPAVGFLDPRARYRRQPSEVAEIFEVPLSFVLDHGNHQPHVLERDGQSFRFHAIPYGDYYIWGATAAILRALSHLLTEYDPKG